MENILVGYQINESMCWRKFRFPNKHKILNTIFERYVYDLYDDYRVREEIDVLVIENAIFYHDVKLHCPKDTKLILKNCTFLGRYVQFMGGDISLISPRFLDYLSSKQISGEAMEKFNVVMDKSCDMGLSIIARARDISIKVCDEVNWNNYSLCLDGDNIEINGIRNLVEAKIISKNLSFKYSDLKFVSSSKGSKIETENLLLGSSKLSSKVMGKIHCKKVEVYSCDEFRKEDNLEIGVKRRKRKQSK